MTDRLKTSDYRDSRLTVSPSISIFSKDPENTEAADLQRKLEMLNNMMDQEARAEQARRQILYNIGHCKYRQVTVWMADFIEYSLRRKKKERKTFSDRFHLLTGSFARDTQKRDWFFLSFEKIWFANKWSNIPTQNRKRREIMIFVLIFATESMSHKSVQSRRYISVAISAQRSVHIPRFSTDFFYRGWSMTHSYHLKLAITFASLLADRYFSFSFFFHFREERSNCHAVNAVIFISRSLICGSSLRHTYTLIHTSDILAVFLETVAF